MNLREATVALAQYVRETGKPVSESARENTDILISISDQDRLTLMQEALAMRANQMLLRPPKTIEPEGREIEVSVEPYNNAVMQKTVISCQILEDTVYHVNGVAKSLAKFTIDDVQIKLQASRNLEAGVIRYRKMWEVAEEMLAESDIKVVGELEESKQLKIAQAVSDAREAREMLAIA